MCVVPQGGVVFQAPYFHDMFLREALWSRSDATHPGEQKGTSLNSVYCLEHNTWLLSQNYIISHFCVYNNSFKQNSLFLFF